MSIDAGKKQLRGRPRVDSEEVAVRMDRPLLDALDAWRGAQDDKPGRPEAVRRVLAEHFTPELPRKTAMSPDVVEKAAKARSKAAARADVEMKGLDETTDEKSRRRAALIEKPEMIAKARGKRRSI